jgi:hypothetical protein
MGVDKKKSLCIPHNIKTNSRWFGSLNVEVKTKKVLIKIYRGRDSNIVTRGRKQKVCFLK